MKVCYRQSGGIAGITKGVDLDVDALSPDEASLVHRILPRLREACQAAAPLSPQPDVRQIMVEVSDGGETSRLLLDERKVPEELKPLVQLLAAKAQYLRR